MMTCESRHITVLFLADTHLGFDLPEHPRVDRPRRGDDFFANFARALAPAMAGRVDLVLHGGDLFYRSRVSTGLVKRVLEPIRAVTAQGIPFVFLPGNHERSAAPFPLLWDVPGLYVFARPETLRFDLAGLRLALAGFPHVRTDLAHGWEKRLAAMGVHDKPADVRVLCLHQTVEGAAVGKPRGGTYVFRRGRDVIVGRSLPRGYAAVLSGHIHRHQFLQRDLAGRPLTAPVIYPGATTATSFAEWQERKGFLLLELAPTADGTGRLAGHQFVQVPSRPMVRHELEIERLAHETSASRPAKGEVSSDLRNAIVAEIRGVLAETPHDAIVRFVVRGGDGRIPGQLPSAAEIRAFAGPRRIVELRVPTARRPGM